MERSHSGRVRLLGKQVYPQGYRGFESLSLRQEFKLKQKQRCCFCRIRKPERCSSSVRRGRDLFAVAKRVVTESLSLRQEIFMKQLKDGAQCKVIEGTHVGKFGVVKDINTSKTGQITITVLQSDGERFKTLAKNIELI